MTLLTTWISALLALATATAAPPQAVSPQRAVLDRYCVTCHTQKAKERGAVPIALDSIDPSYVGGNADLWEKVIRKMRAGLMPPAGSPRPDPATVRDLIASLEMRLDQAVESNP